MAVISDLTGIPHFTTSRGSTVRSDFLRALLHALGRNPEGLVKEELIQACVEAATTRPFDQSLLSPGGTVTNQALQVIVDGITEHGAPGRLPARVVAVSEEQPIDAAEFDPAEVRDERSRQLAVRAAREGQDTFRTRVLEAYAGRCALTGSNAVGALEAAHITPYRGSATNVMANGICLRADIHRLWDSGQIAIHEDTREIIISDALRVTTYADLAGRRARLPHNAGNHPSWAALRAHRHWCDL
jgi:hypothetical protein